MWSPEDVICYLQDTKPVTPQQASKITLLVVFGFLCYCWFFAFYFLFFFFEGGEGREATLCMYMNTCVQQRFSKRV